ncbi:hypothetical protein CDL15_Pgr019335 [Punica granatum]|nr:hypothetical protein CDL15_Pgr019335 [Punica granatum]
MDQQQSNFKHFCKICKKGFMCGRALGGHMRAHGIGDEGGHLDDEDPASDWEDKHGEPIPPGNKRMYALRTNPNRLKSCRVCENCGKEFSSWKSFLEHGKCTSEDVESLVSSHDSEDEDGMGRRGCGWSKRKRSLRIKIDSGNSNCPSSEEEDLANCLMMLSNAKVDASMAEPEESCASASKDEERRKPINFVSPFTYRVPSNNNLDKAKGVAARGLFECKACKKVFNSHQALGGHRASHKKVKGCFAARLDTVDDYIPDDDVITHEEFFPTKSTSSLPFDHGPNSLVPSTSKRKSKVHECSICHRVFSSGQALGGHKRCHWITSNSPDTSSLAKLQQFHDHLEQIQQRPKFIEADRLALKLDLNLPAPSDELAGARRGAVATGFERSTEIYLQSWLGLDRKEREVMQSHHHHPHPEVNNNEKECGSNKNDDTVHNNNNNNNNNNNENTESNVDDEGDSKAKLAKLSELKDMNISGGGSSSSWLQVGIGSTTTTDHHRQQHERSSK